MRSAIAEKPQILVVPDSPIGKECVGPDVLQKFKQDIQAFYGLQKIDPNLFTISENFDNFCLFYKTGKYTPDVIIRRFRKGKTISLTPEDYDNVNKKFKAQQDKIIREQEIAQQIEARKTIAELILKGLTAENLQFEVQKHGAIITILDTQHKHHITCVLNFNGVIEMPLIKLNYPIGKKVQITELERLVKFSNEQIQIALKMAQQVKNMLPKEWFEQPRVLRQKNITV